MITAISPVYSSRPSAEMGGVVAQKSVLRREIIACRRQLGEQQRAVASRLICEKLMALPQYQQARHIAAFAPMAEEVDIWQLLENAVQDDKIIALPRISNSRQRLLTFHQYRGRRSLSAGYKGILEPAAQQTIINKQLFDFIVVPAVAVDKNNLRLGYGGGFYDKVLYDCKSAYSCAAIFRCQLTDALPSENHDQSINHVITE